MKVFSPLLFLSFISLFGFGNTLQINPTVDERTELLCVVFRLAGLDEYNFNRIATYAERVDTYFTPFKNHEVVKLAQHLNKKNSVSYNAVMSMAINIEIGERIQFNANISEDNLDKRWGKKNAIQFLEYLNAFYTESEFREFFNSRKDFYAEATKNYETVLKSLDLMWFANFFGQEPNGDFRLVLTFTNRGCYGPDLNFKDGRRDVYAILGPWFTDSLGFPTYTEYEIPILVHEYSHSFSNPVVDEFYPLFKKQAKHFYKPVAQMMKKQAYGIPKAMLYETIVRACVIKYFKYKQVDESRIKKYILSEQTKGFLWVAELVQLLDEYEGNRDLYPDFRAFMPRIAELQNSLDPEVLKERIEQK